MSFAYSSVVIIHYFLDFDIILVDCFGDAFPGLAALSPVCSPLGKPALSYKRNAHYYKCLLSVANFFWKICRCFLLACTVSPKLLLTFLKFFKNVFKQSDIWGQEFRFV